MKSITDCSINAYNRYRRLEQLHDPENREMYLEAVAAAVETVTDVQGRALTRAEIKDIEENVNVMDDGVLSGELEFDLLAEHVRKGIPFAEAAILASEDARNIRLEMFDETLN